jgi:hypothetical protein
MTLPNFLIIGAQKAGTTWLANLLGRHPEVFIPPREIHYFNIEENFRKGLAWYERHFEEAGGRKAIGEKTPNYFWVTESTHSARTGTHVPHVHHRLHEALPDAKIIVLLRDPVQRAISAINHLVRMGHMPPDCDIDEVFFGRQQDLGERFGVVDMGRYARHLEAYRGCYPEDQMLVLTFEDDVAISPEKGLVKACEFLGIDSGFEFPGREERIGEYHGGSLRAAKVAYRFPSMRRAVKIVERRVPSVLGGFGTRLLGPSISKLSPSDATRERLYELYAPENRLLASMIGRVPPAWIR